MSETNIEIGDSVEIINGGRLHPTYREMSKILKAKKWQYGYCEYSHTQLNGKQGKVINIEDANKPYRIALVDIREHEILIGLDGLKKIGSKNNSFEMNSIWKLVVENKGYTNADVGDRMQITYLYEDGDIGYKWLDNDVGTGVASKKTILDRFVSEDSCPFEIGQVRQFNESIYKIINIKSQSKRLQIEWCASGNKSWLEFSDCTNDRIVIPPHGNTLNCRSILTPATDEVIVPLDNNFTVGLTVETSSGLNKVFKGYKKEDDMFSVCEYKDEILTALTGLKVFQKRKYENAFDENQAEINRQINSEFWEDGTIPKKERVIELLKEKMGVEKDTK